MYTMKSAYYVIILLVTSSILVVSLGAPGTLTDHCAPGHCAFHGMLSIQSNNE